MISNKSLCGIGVWVACMQMLWANPRMEVWCKLTEVARVDIDSFVIEIEHVWPVDDGLDTATIIFNEDTIRVRCPETADSLSLRLKTVGVSGLKLNETIKFFIDRQPSFEQLFTYSDTLAVGQSWILTGDYPYSFGYKKAWTTLGGPNPRGFIWKGFMKWLAPNSEDTVVLEDLRTYQIKKVQCVGMGMYACNTTYHSPLFTDSTGFFRDYRDLQDTVKNIYVIVDQSGIPLLPTIPVPFSSTLIYGDSVEADLIIVSEFDPREPLSPLAPQLQDHSIYQVVLKNQKVYVQVPEHYPFELMPLSLELYDVHGRQLKSYAIRSGSSHWAYPKGALIGVLRTPQRRLYQSRLVR